ncbi:MAG: hypothetical protein IJK27_02125 [Bacilli bacterium]|nr:hypothetical protein [Bacilli bacterium]
MNFSKSNVIYNLLLNLPVCVMLTLTAQFMNNGGFQVYASDFFINFAISFPIAMAIGLILPLLWLGRWFTALFGVRNDTYTHNILYRCLATFFSSLLYSLILSPISYLINRLIFDPTYPIGQYALDCLKTIPVMVAVGFVSSLFFDIPAYRVAHKIDPNF